MRTPTAIPEAIVPHVNLHVGEVEALALALEMRADAVLIDDAVGRAIAVHLGLRPIGVLGILVRAKRHGQIEAVAPVIHALLARAHFHVAPDLMREVLRLSGEAP